MSNEIEDKIFDYMRLISDKVLEKVIKSDEEYKKVTDISLKEMENLKNKYNIAGIILDIDGTIKSEGKEISKEVEDWIELLKRSFKVCIVSNGGSLYVKNIADKYSIPHIGFALKPMRKSFLKAAETMGIEPENVLVIGNEYIADIFGGKRSGMNTAKVKDLDLEEYYR